MQEQTHVIDHLLEIEPQTFNSLNILLRCVNFKLGKGAVGLLHEVEVQVHFDKVFPDSLQTVHRVSTVVQVFYRFVQNLFLGLDKVHHGIQLFVEAVAQVFAHHVFPSVRFHQQGKF